MIMTVPAPRIIITAPVQKIIITAPAPTITWILSLFVFPEMNLRCSSYLETV